MIECCGIWLPDEDTHFVDHVAASPLVDGKGTYQLHKIDMALRFTEGRRTAIDIGAHVGLISRVLALRFERVVAFEPMPEHVACFVENVTADNVTLYRCALGAMPGKARMVAIAGNSGHSHVTDDGNLAVTMCTMDSFKLENVDFMKIDTEGYERQIVLGAVDTLKRCKPTLLVEQKPNNGRRYGHGDLGALQLLEKLGARIVGKKAGDYVLTW